MLTYFGAGEPHEVEAWGAYDITPLSRPIAGLTNLHREFAADPSDFDICAPSKDAVADSVGQLLRKRRLPPERSAGPAQRYRGQPLQDQPRGFAVLAAVGQDQP